MATPEGKVKAKIKALFKEHGVWFYMPVSRGFGMHGVPDFLCCVDGKFFAVEAKAGNAKPTGLQTMQMEAAQRAGARVFITNEANFHELEGWLKHIDGMELR